MKKRHMRIPMIFYHAIMDEGIRGEKYSIGIKEFRRQIEYLHSKGYKGLVLDDLYRQGAVRDGEKAVLITFDDGHASDYSMAYPVLLEFGFKANFFITAGWVGTPNYVSWEELRTMHGAGMSIQSHSMTHSFMSDLSAKGLSAELLGSKQLISEKLGSRVDYISLPGGFCSRKVLNMAEKLGYKAVCTSRPGVAGSLDKVNFAVLNRLLITGRTPWEEFLGIVHANRRLLASYMGKYYFKTVMRKAIGSQLYYRIWSLLCKKG